MRAHTHTHTISILISISIYIYIYIYISHHHQGVLAAQILDSLSLSLSLWRLLLVSPLYGIWCLHRTDEISFYHSANTGLSIGECHISLLHI